VLCVQPQQNYYPHPQPVRLRANPGVSVVAGLLALLTAGLLGWFAVANMQEHDYPEPWPGVVRINVIGGFGAAGVLVLVAMFTFARTLVGAWTLGVASLFFATMIVITPLLRGQDVSAHFDWVFGFGKATGVAIGLTVIAGVLTAFAAVVAAVARRP
jgi:hypothetical protein